MSGFDKHLILYLLWRVDHLQKLTPYTLFPSGFYFPNTRARTQSEEAAVVAFARSQSQLIWHKQNLRLISCLLFIHVCVATDVHAQV